MQSLDIIAELQTPRAMAADRQRWSALLSAAIHAASGAAPRSPSTRHVGRVAVVPVCGGIGYRSAFARYYGCELTELSAQLAQLASDNAVGAIVLDVNSPGGTVDGVPELADQIRAIPKPTLAISRTFTASAAYWLSAACDVVLTMASGEVGSIGVWSAHVDVSGFEQRMGVKTTLIASSSEKIEGNPYEPLSDEARADMQKSVDHYYALFSGAVSRYRGLAVTPAMARCLNAPEAARVGLVDGVVADLGDAVRHAAALADLPAGKRRAYACELDLARHDGTPPADRHRAALARVRRDGSYTEPWQRAAEARRAELARITR